MHITRTKRTRWSAAVLATAMMGLLLPWAAQAGEPVALRCNALITAPDGLDLVAPSGKVLSRFNIGGAQASFLSISPDGRKVAYATDQMATTFKVINSKGQRGSFRIYPKSRSSSAYLMGLHWNSNNVVRLTTFWGKDYAKFDFRQVPNSLARSATTTTKPAFGENCKFNSTVRRVACIEQEGELTLRGGVIDGKNIFSVSGFVGIKPEESLILGVGKSAYTRKTKQAYKVTVKSVDANGITLRISPPEGGWWQQVVTNGGFTTTPPVFQPTYGFFATIINSQKDLVRINVVKNNAPQNPFDSGLAWQAHGQGLVFVQRTNTQTFLDLIQSGNVHVGKDSAKGKAPQWHLAAQAPIALSGKVRAMRFLTPSLLLLDTGDFRGPQYSEVSVHIAKDAENGKLTMTAGNVKPLPNAISIKQNGKTIEGSVLDWSCMAAQGRGGGG